MRVGGGGGGWTGCSREQHETAVIETREARGDDAQAAIIAEQRRRTERRPPANKWLQGRLLPAAESQIANGNRWGGDVGTPSAIGAPRPAVGNNLCFFVCTPSRQVIGSTMSARDTIAKFNKTAADTDRKLGKNPFSDTYNQPVHKKTDPSYGRPEAGSATERRGIKAGVYVGREIIFLCEIIDKHATVSPDDQQQKQITFGPLFYLYSHYSDKLVGMLLRARKYGLVHFEGEMLYQRQDDHKIITLLKPIDAIRQAMKSSNDPAKCLKID
uniref:Costars domain-containing protein n=1 Tax=Plectus sambesii TaxID=2011161 RepID=A0A914WEI4_9BILA